MVKVVKNIHQTSDSNIDQMWKKLSQAENMSETELNKIDNELDRVAKEIQEENTQIKNLLKGILAEAKQRVGQSPEAIEDQIGEKYSKMVV